MNEEDEFGMSQMSRDADPLEHEEKSAVNDHPDFNFLDSKVIHTALASDDKRTVPLWMTRSPLEDPNQWRILEVQIRPDRSWEVIKELVTTVCISKGLLLTEEHANSVLFRKKVSQELMAHGMANIAIYLNVYVRIGVSPSKMRVLDICTSVLEENKLLNGVVSTGRKSWWTVQEHTQPYEYALDQLLGALQSTLLCQCLSLSHLYMSTPETSMDSVDKAELDEGYVEDLKRAFSSEMKANIRDLCIPLESYAYDQELNCALLIGLLEPTLKKYAIKLMDTSTRDISSDGNLCESTASVRAFILNGDGSALNETQSSSLQEPKPVDLSASTQQTEANKIYGEVISEMGQNLWRACKEDCETRLRVKIREKQLQVSARVEAVHSLRRRAIRAIMEAYVLPIEAASVDD
ncbi:hypothetical protein PsorP6_004117 [Peronosclerospora sorghi]|uniref:Uncharacterized protein n=1 Tax=Peronosclerospora sorghi TaxID=230839 RepID=A0ACC0VM02_9STRA|nr:hypothetical protein PsorP6_004117 [Peronosclerospora sorghi]